MAVADTYLPKLFPFLDFAGFSGTDSNAGSVDLSGPFFQTEPVAITTRATMQTMTRLRGWPRIGNFAS
jgi:hypothetical protein